MSVPNVLVKIAATAALAITLAGCGGIGSGSALQSLEIVKSIGPLDLSSHRSYVCFSDQLQVIGTFTDGSRGDFTSRAIWTSSDPTAVKVSNGDILIDPDVPNSFALQGRTFPQKAGMTARITATFVGLSASYDVETALPDTASLRIVPVSQFDAASPAPQNIAIGSFEQYVAQIKLDGFLVNVTQLASWSLLAEGNGTTDEPVATINRSTGLVTGVRAGNPTIKATFTACASGAVRAANPEVAAMLDGATRTANVRKLEADGLALDPEFDATTAKDPTKLIKLTVQRFKARGTFASGPDQDLSNQVVLISDQPKTEVPQRFLFPALGLRTAVAANNPGAAVTFRACFDPEPRQNDNDLADFEPIAESCFFTSETERDPNAIFSPVDGPKLEAVEGTLTSIAITPLKAAVDAQAPQQFKARGNFGPNVFQDVTRVVNWTSANPAVAQISSGASGGLAIARGFTDQAPVDITATGTTILGDASIKSNPPARLCIFAPTTIERPCAEAPPTP